jgi:hypothetical protein
VCVKIHFSVDGKILECCLLSLRGTRLKLRLWITNIEALNTLKSGVDVRCI